MLMVVCLPALVLADTVTKMVDFKVTFNETEKVYVYTGQIMLRAKGLPAAFSYAYLVDVNTGETIDQAKTDKEGFFKLSGQIQDLQIMSSSRPLSPKSIKTMLKNYKEGWRYEGILSRIRGAVKYFFQGGSMELRNNLRVLSDFPVDLRETSLSHSNTLKKGRVIDLSETGAGLFLEKPLSQTSEVDLTVSIAEFSMQVKAQVVWSNFTDQEKKFYYGVRFSEVKENTLSTLREIVETKKRVITASYFPEKIMTNHQIIEAGLATTSKALERGLGAMERRVAAPGETAADMMAKVAEKILKKAGYKAQNLDYIICSTDLGDAIEPETATAVQAKIGASCPAFGVSMSCTGWIATLDIALNYLAAGKKRILLLASSLVGSRAAFYNLMHRAIFGDGAGGMLLEQHHQGNFLARSLWTNGNYYYKIFLPFKWSDLPEEIPIEYRGSFYMAEDQKVFFDAMDKYLVPFTNGLLNKAKVALEDIDIFLLHYPSRLLFEHSLKALGFPREKTYNNFKTSGNIATAEMPVLFEEAVSKGIIKKGEKVLMLTYGAGFTMGGIIMQY